MLTKTFRTIRVFIHLLTLIILLINLGLLAIKSTIFGDYINLESKISKGTINMRFFYTFTGITNIIMALFGSCSLNSKIKLYMNIFLFCKMISICYVFASVIFIKFFYTGIFNDDYNSFVGTSYWNQYFVGTALHCNISNPEKCNKVLEDYYLNCTGTYIALTLFSNILSIAIFCLIKIASKNRIREDRSKTVPPINEYNKVGFSSTSLRVRRFIDTKIPLDPLVQHV